MQLDFINFIDKRVVLLGCNLNNIYLAKFLMEKQAKIHLCDFRAKEECQLFFDRAKKEGLTIEGMEFHFGEFNLRVFEEAHLIVYPEGFFPRHEVMEAARLRGVRIYSELEFVSKFISNKPIISVCGSSGKTTTVSMLSYLLEKSGFKVFHNVVKPLSQLLCEDISQYTHIVVETEVFQLEGIESFKPTMNIFLNLHPDFMNYFGSHESYMLAYQRILQNGDANVIQIINGVDPSLEFLRLSCTGRKILFGLPQNEDHLAVSQPAGAWFEGNQNKINFRAYPGADVQSFDFSEFRIRGTHTRQNIMAALLAAFQMGVKVSAIEDFIANFKALDSRMKYLGRSNSVSFYDDTHSSNVASLMYSLESFEEPIILIAGGYDKDLDFNALIPYVRRRTKNLILIGESKESLNRILGDHTETFLVGTLKEAVMLAYQKSRSGDIVLYSPGCADCHSIETVNGRSTDFQKLIQGILSPKKVNRYARFARR